MGAKGQMSASQLLQMPIMGSAAGTVAMRSSLQACEVDHCNMQLHSLKAASAGITSAQQGMMLVLVAISRSSAIAAVIAWVDNTVATT